MQNKSSLIWYSFLFLLLILLVVGYKQIEWVEKSADIGPKPEIRRQFYLVAQRLLAMDNVPLQAEQGFSRLDAPFPPIGDSNSENNTFDKNSFPTIDDSILIADGYGSLSDNRAEKLLDWVSAGGHLFVTAHNPYLTSIEDRRDYIFDYFGVYALTEAEIELASSDQETSKNADKNDNDADQPASLQEAIDQQFQDWSPFDHCVDQRDNLPIQVYEGVDVTLGFSGLSALSFNEEVQDDFSYWDSNNAGIQIIQRPFGDGMVTFLTEMESWKNHYIACLDNAYLLRFFVGNSDRVFILTNQDSPSIISLLWKNFPYFLSLAIISILLLVWRHGQRFGDIKSKPLLSRRSITEHIEASALFVWRHKSTRWKLIHVVQYGINQKMTRRHPNFNKKSLAQKCEIIANATNLEPQHIEKVFSMIEELEAESAKNSKKVLTEQSFVSLMKELKNIEDKI